MRFEKAWVEQCKATRTIRRRFGAKSALDYLIGEKLMVFADAARDDPAFARELPRFLATVWHIFNEYEIGGYVASRKTQNEKSPSTAPLFALTDRHLSPSLQRVRVNVGHLRGCGTFEQNDRPMRISSERRRLWKETSLRKRTGEICVRLPFDDDTAVNEVVDGWRDFRASSSARAGSERNRRGPIPAGPGACDLELRDRQLGVEHEVR
jgi:hypothetical protein